MEALVARYWSHLEDGREGEGRGHVPVPYPQTSTIPSGRALTQPALGKRAGGEEHRQHAVPAAYGARHMAIDRACLGRRRRARRTLAAQPTQGSRARLVGPLTQAGRRSAAARECRGRGRASPPVPPMFLIRLQVWVHFKDALQAREARRALERHPHARAALGQPRGRDESAKAPRAGVAPSKGVAGRRGASRCA